MPRLTFTRDQLIFTYNCILMAVIDRVEGCLPSGGCPLEERKRQYGEAYKRLTDYESGALECAGMAIATIYAQITGDGMGVQDALDSPVGDTSFQDEVEQWVFDIAEEKEVPKPPSLPFAQSLADITLERME